MKWITEEKDPKTFFKYYLVKVCNEASVNIAEKFLQIEYLSKMLTKFVEPKKYFNDSADMVRIIDILKEEVDKIEISIDAYRKAADKILFYQSFFQKLLKKECLI